MKAETKLRTLFVLLVVLVTSVIEPGPTLSVVRSAHAVVGRPLTPVSYAGVARRTTRRAAYAGAVAPSPYW